MPTQDYYIKGSEVKFLVTLTATGFSMDDNDFSLVVSCGGVSRTFGKADLFFDGDDNGWYLCFDTSEFRSGTMVITSYARVPDDDFPDGFRTEMAVTTVGTLKTR